MVGGIESFKVTVFIRLFFTGFECEEGAVGMILADIGNTASQGLEPDCFLPAAFTLGFFRHNDQVSGVPLEITDTIRFFFTGFECKKKGVSMILADIFKTALH